MPLEFTLENVAGEPNLLIAYWMEPQTLQGAVIISYSLTCTLYRQQVDGITKREGYNNIVMKYVKFKLELGH